MSIANELSCDVAAAMLTSKEGHTTVGNKALTDIVLEFHTTLRRLMGESRQHRRSQILITPPPSSSSSPSSNSSAASGGC